MFMNVYALVALFFGWRLISKIQDSSHIIFFTTVSNYVVGKIVLSILLGTFITPFCVLWYIGKAIRYCWQKCGNKGQNDLMEMENHSDIDNVTDQDDVNKR